MIILIVKFGAFGDVVRTSYFLKPLLDKYTNAKIYWITSTKSKDLLIHNPFIFYLTDKFSELKNIFFDWIISLDDEFEILSGLKEIKSMKITGAYINDNNTVNYSTDSALWFDMGLISKYGKEKADRLKKHNKLSHSEIFSKILKIENIKPYFFNSKQIEYEVKSNFANNYYHIGINSGAGKRWPSKSMTITEVVKLIKYLCSQKVNNKQVFINLLGGEDENERNKIILELTDKCKYIRILDTSKSLLNFAAVIKCCDYIISSDSLALHLAISQGVKNLSFYAPTSASEIDVFGTGVKVISTSNDYCNYKSECDNSSITAERVIKSFNNHFLQNN